MSSSSPISRSPGSTTPWPKPAVKVPPDWASATACISEVQELTPPVVLVCGPKNSGKSTFSRLLLNSLLPRYGRAGYLDTDVGQPEFSPSGCLSVHVVDEPIADLVNPTLRKPERCCFYGDLSSKGDPETYLNCIFRLYDYYVGKYRFGETRESAMLPLIVNTPGWVKGVGFDMLVETLRYICPTIVVQIHTERQWKNLPDGMFWLDGGQTGPKMIDIDATLPKSSLKRKDAGGWRERRLVEYFKQCFPSEMSLKTNKELAYGLASLPPYEVSLSDVTVVHLHYKVPPTEIWRSLNATIVGLAISSDTAEETAAVPWCVGLGIIRGVDVQRGVLYVITPVSPEILQNVDLLLQGLIEIPKSLLQVKGYVSPYMSTNVWRTKNGDTRNLDSPDRNLDGPDSPQNAQINMSDSDEDM